MLTGMTEEDWATVLRVFTASCSRRGAKMYGPAVRRKMMLAD